MVRVFLFFGGIRIWRNTVIRIFYPGAGGTSTLGEIRPTGLLRSRRAVHYSLTHSLTVCRQTARPRRVGLGLTVRYFQRRAGVQVRFSCKDNLPMCRPKLGPQIVNDLEVTHGRSYPG
jgi:hypothetical protein